MIIFYYKPDVAGYSIEAYIMGTDGKYPEKPSKTEQPPKAAIGTKVRVTTDTAYWIGDAKKDGFTFDKDNPNNIIEDTVKGDGSTVLRVYFSRNQYTLNWVVTKDDDASYNDSDSTEYYFEQPVNKPDIDVPDFYDFDNWAKGGVEWPQTMPHSNVDIAGELIRQRTDLVISKSGMKDGETAIFTVTGKELGSGLKVIVPNGESVTIKDLPVGETYTVSEQNGWSWKYEAQDSVTRTLTNGSTATASFTNVPKIIKWFTDEFYIDNRFGIWR